MSYAKLLTRAVPQSRSLPRQVKNNAGGYVFEVNRWQRLARFLILGADKGSYYQGATQLVRENAAVVQECAQVDGPRTVSIIACISEAGRAPSNDPAILALALVASSSNSEARQAALAALPRVVRTGAHLFTWVENIAATRGFGRALRRATAGFYTTKSPKELCYQVVKYRQRGGFSHRDVLRLTHPTPPAGLERVLAYVAAKTPAALAGTGALPEYLEAFEELKHADEARTLELIRAHRFTHEMIATQHKRSPRVWEALLEDMPLTAVIRNLAKMTQVGVLDPMSMGEGTVLRQLGNATRIKRARLHPLQVLLALRTYQRGEGFKGKLRYVPNQRVLDALDGAFYAAFESVEPSGQTILLGIDVSGSMALPRSAGNCPLTAREAAAALAMCVVRKESNYHVFGFSERFVELPITPRMRLDQVIGVMSNLPFERTDCALPMLYAKEKKMKVDMFQVYTDNETYFGKIHPVAALLEYRQWRGGGAKLAVAAFTPTAFTIADPADPDMLDLAGLDASTPAVLANFGRGFAA